MPGLHLCGNENNYIDVNARQIMNAIRQGQKVDVLHANINGDLDLGLIASSLEKDSSGHPIVKAHIRINYCRINGSVNFSHATFLEELNFSNTIFLCDAQFESVDFRGSVYFDSAVFCNNAYFNFSSFDKLAYFVETSFKTTAMFNSVFFLDDTSFESSTFVEGIDFRMAKAKNPANFSNINFRENTTLVGLWNSIFYSPFFAMAKFISCGRIRLSSWTVTDFTGFDVDKIIDGSSNPYLKRYINDEQWIHSWQTNKPLRKIVFYLWELTSHCGRSFSLWMFWGIVVASLFGAVYADYSAPSWLPKPIKEFLFIVDPRLQVDPFDRPDSFYTPYYLSIVVFTTLGFGDVTPRNLAGEIWISLEVIIGYIMLGILVSISANKFARRS